MNKKIIANRKTTAAGFILSIATIMPTIAGEWTFEPSLTYSMYSLKPANSSKIEATLYKLNLEFETEDNLGNFHRVWGTGTIYDNEKSKLDTDLRVNEAVYRIGKYFYPQAEPTDFSMWVGVGYREIEQKSRLSEKIKDTVIYLPLGFEYAAPMDNRGTWPTGFSAQRNHNHFLVTGAELNLLVHAEGSDDRWKESNGYGYKAWVGYDYRLKNNRVITTSLSYEALKIDKVNKATALNFTLGLRLL